MDVRLVRADDVAPLGAVLARSFDADPIFRAILPDDAHRARALPLLFAEWLRRLHLPLGTSYTTDDHAGAALWSPPDRWQIGVLQQAVMAPRMLRALGGRTLVALRVLLAVEGPHPHHPPHYYLRVIGCEPSRQGQGVGAALLEPVLGRCDAEGVAAYLESSNERNLPFYRRLGFEAIGEVTTHLGPKAVLMWRAGRSKR
ncbi:MAG: GNAT family N-acetyltransferase [Polyangiaceae bacterium]